jgi:hypothetical protein
MRRLRVTGTMRRQLHALNDARSGKGRGGVMVVPRMLNVEAWERVAVEAQSNLIADARNDLHGTKTPGLNSY